MVMQRLYTDTSGRFPGAAARFAMTIQLKPEQESRITQALHSGAYQNPDEVIDRALEILHERDEWLMANRQAFDGKIRRGIDELERGEGIPEDELDAHLERLKNEPE
jgi:antitoxin ParD1/3/4